MACGAATAGGQPLARVVDDLLAVRDLGGRVEIRRFDTPADIAALHMLRARSANDLARRWLDSYEAPYLDPGIQDGLKDFIAKKKESMPDAFT